MKLLAVGLILSVLLSATAETKLKALIVDGQSNHPVWPKSTIMMKQYLEETGLFEVEVDRTRFTWKALEANMAGGGGFVSVHAAQNGPPPARSRNRFPPISPPQLNPNNARLK